ncbi:MAG: hypothetical protein COT17_05985 [Elusimicrobia bacterium CG08_land_8_20_14_0_20_51_18]|nr:MAG: hypothetical protein COT17_05985 [Elusimicrobia bacterium CG08_land_8_20_14_0_20_51_18]
MKKIIFSIIALFISDLSAAGAGGAVPADIVNHKMEIEIIPAEGLLKVSDTLTLPPGTENSAFYLNKHLKLEETSGAEISLVTGERIKSYDTNLSSKSGVNVYEIRNAKKNEPVKLRYSGKINEPLAEITQEYSRSFRETTGIISEEGCYLSGSTYFYPEFEELKNTLEASVTLPAGYKAVTYGEKTKETLFPVNVSFWKETKPQDDLTLVCGKFAEYSAKDGEKTYYVFLQKADEKLAAQYLDASKKYVNFYSELIAPYPYKKFALVENFWDTGYGMPSFTLLGPKVIRLPFIISSSYPHEILHNWWGNGVFVDYKSGNWCEGLTVYLADYLIKENRGKGREYRMTTLQKYRDYVERDKDFPLTDFTSRQSSAQEAVGYGKSMMFYHMLRLKLGDKTFLRGLRDFYKKNEFKNASFEDLRNSLENVSGKNLKSFFEQWINRPGAPGIKAKDVRLEKENGIYKITFNLYQNQENLYRDLQVPVYIGFKEMVLRANFFLSEKEKNYLLTFEKEPLNLEIDPDFDLFRKLSPKETPVSLSKLLGAEKPLIILPADASAENKKHYSAFAELWNKDPENRPEIKKDSEIKKLPGGRSVWIIGGENKFRALLNENLKGFSASVNDKYFSTGRLNVETASKTLVLAAYNPQDENEALGFVISDSPEKLGLLSSKLPHYGKYSWLVFDENMTLSKNGVWETGNSPLKFSFSSEKPVTKAEPAPLGELPSVFSKKELSENIKALASGKGRFPGTAGFSKAQKRILSKLKEYSLKPFSAGFAQSFSFNSAGKKIKTENLLAAVEGKKKKDEFLVLSAHYDHLKAEGDLSCPGANDNASGVSLLLELARYYEKNPADRTIIFAFFSAEEEGRLGSKYFTENLEPGLLSKINANLNFDNIGALGKRKLLVLNSDSSDKWVHILRGAGFVTQLDYETVKEPLDSSDQASFIEKGIPAIQLFDGGGPDYHKPLDTADKIDFAGIVKFGEFSKEIIDYLAGDSDFPSRPGKTGSNPASEQGTRKVSTGLMPDFSFQGKGVMAQEIAANSPFAKAGLKPGDIIVKINGENVDGLKAYSEKLKNFKPGDKMRVTYVSAGTEKTAEIILEEKK